MDSFRFKALEGPDRDLDSKWPAFGPSRRVARPSSELYHRDAGREDRITFLWRAWSLPRQRSAKWLGGLFAVH